MVGALFPTVSGKIILGFLDRQVQVIRRLAPESADVSDDVQDIAAFYNRDPDTERGRLDQHQLEYDLAWRYLTRYLPPQGTILEVGAASGKYTLELAKRGGKLQRKNF